MSSISHHFTGKHFSLERCLCMSSHPFVFTISVLIHGMPIEYWAKVTRKFNQYCLPCFPWRVPVAFTYWLIEATVCVVFGPSIQHPRLILAEVLPVPLVSTAFCWIQEMAWTFAKWKFIKTHKWFSLHILFLKGNKISANNSNGAFIHSHPKKAARLR